jgi:hypothetical protein
MARRNERTSIVADKKRRKESPKVCKGKVQNVKAQKPLRIIVVGMFLRSRSPIEVFTSLSSPHL